MDRILRILTRASVIDDGLAREIEEHSETADLHIVFAAIECGVDERVIAESLASACHAPLLDFVRIWDDAVGLLTEEECLHYKCLPIQIVDPGNVVIGFVDPSDVDALDNLRFALGRKVSPRTIVATTFVEQRERLWPLDRARLVLQFIHDHADTLASRSARLVECLISDCANDQCPVEIEFSDTAAEISALWHVTSQDGRYDLTEGAIQHFREVAGVPIASGTGPLLVNVGGESWCFEVEFSTDNSLTRLAPISRAEFEERYGLIPE